jgi:hypothetical protein
MGKTYFNLELRFSLVNFVSITSASSMDTLVAFAAILELEQGTIMYTFSLDLGRHQLNFISNLSLSLRTRRYTPNGIGIYLRTWTTNLHVSRHASCLWIFRSSLSRVVHLSC